MPEILVRQEPYGEDDVKLRNEVVKLRVDGLTAASLSSAADSCGFAAARLLTDLTRPIVQKAATLDAFRRATFDAAGNSDSAGRLARWLQRHQGLCLD